MAWPLITLVGYTEWWHTNRYSWSAFAAIFRHLGFDVEWTSAPAPSSRHRLWICWRRPSAEALVNSGLTVRGDIVLQKLHAFEDETEIDYGDDPEAFFRTWHWPVYASIERLLEAGVEVYGFGCKTSFAEFPEKARIVRKLGPRIFWIPYGSAHVWPDDLARMRPVMDEFCYDIGYVGSRWGRPGMGNLEAMERFLDPLLVGRTQVVAGNFGSDLGQVDEIVHRSILTKSKLCPIVHAPFWRAERGIQDRFWTVFSFGRFGVVDNEGVYDFFDRGEVVCAPEAGEYVERSLYFLTHPEKQRSYIERIQARIAAEYNLVNSWKRILTSLRAFGR